MEKEYFQEKFAKPPKKGMSKNYTLFDKIAL
jgi:hypothetical protein